MPRQPRLSMMMLRKSSPSLSNLCKPRLSMMMLSQSSPSFSNLHQPSPPRSLSQPSPPRSLSQPSPSFSNLHQTSLSRILGQPRSARKLTLSQCLKQPSKQRTALSSQSKFVLELKLPLSHHSILMCSRPGVCRTMICLRTIVLQLLHRKSTREFGLWPGTSVPFSTQSTPSPYRKTSGIITSRSNGARASRLSAFLYPQVQR